VRSVYRANFAEDLEIGDPMVVADLLDALGLPSAALIGEAQSSDGKEALRAQTARAVELGVFGAPSFVADGELFWGTDRLDDALAWAERGSAEWA
jgi:2-hydroxychromene-2-carboxylate isomerase